MNPATVLLQQEQARYEAQIDSWIRQVLATQRLADAARLAAHRPQPGSLLRGVRSLVSRTTHRGDQRIEAHLIALVATADRDSLHQARRSLPGYWPRAAQALEARLRGLPSP